MNMFGTFTWPIEFGMSLLTYVDVAGGQDNDELHTHILEPFKVGIKLRKAR